MMKWLCLYSRFYYYRKLAQAMSMTAADLSATAKPWEVHQKTVNIMIEEFYAQVYFYA